MRPAADAIAAAGPAAVAEAAARSVAQQGVTHGAGDARHDFVVDPVPRVFGAAEWRDLAAGLLQRARALDAFVRDAHGERRAVREGVVPADVVDSSVYLERDLVGVLAQLPVVVGIAGPDIVRDQHGALVVLEDNVRTPTLAAYAVAARRAVGCALRTTAPGAPAPPQDADELQAVVRDAHLRLLRAAAPGVADPHVVLLADRDASAVGWELDALGAILGVGVVELRDLAHRGDRLVLRDGGRAVDVVFRRTSEERLRDDGGALNALGAALQRPLRAGTVAVVNAFGTGVADDKRAYPHVEDLVRLFCGEEPLLRSIPTHDVTDPAVRRAVLGRLDELVVKPRSGSGGFGVVVGPIASDAQLRAARAAVQDDPAGVVVQDAVVLSTEPTVVDGRLVQRHVDLRPFALLGPGVAEVLPAALSRVALTEGDLVVNCSQGGGGKDVWALAAAP